MSGTAQNMVHDGGGALRLRGHQEAAENGDSTIDTNLSDLVLLTLITLMRRKIVVMTMQEGKTKKR